MATPIVTPELHLKLAGKDAQGLYHSIGVVLYVPVGEGVTVEVQQAAVEAQVAVLQGTALPAATAYVQSLADAAGLHPDDMATPNQAQYIVDLAVERQYTVKKLAAAITAATGVDLGIPSGASPETVMRLVSEHLRMGQASAVIDAIKSNGNN